MSETTTTKLGPRHWLLGGAVALTMAATMWAAQTQDEADEAAVQPVAGERRAGATPTTARASSPDAAPAAAVSDWSLAERHGWAPVAPSGLAAWQPPPPPPPPAPPPQRALVAAAPAVPAFPYELIGRMEESGATVAFLSGPLRSLGVRAGDVVDGQWRVEQIGPTGMTLTWLPAKLKQTIAFRPAAS